MSPKNDVRLSTRLRGCAETPARPEFTAARDINMPFSTPAPQGHGKRRGGRSTDDATGSTWRRRAQRPTRQ